MNIYDGCGGKSPCLKPAVMGAAITLMFSSPLLSGGPNAEVGSATVRFLTRWSL